ncbi:MAG: hypothetical protein NTX64_17970 [Elusimicrobia bacterium]|nr:hypothetical protein [Elusimicrobiota bacterium]
MARYAFLAWLLAFGAGVALADNGPRPWGHGGHGPSAEDRARFWDKVIQSLRSSDKTATPDEVVQAHLALDRFVEQQKADPNNPKGVQTVANDIDAFIDRWRAQIFTDGPNGLQVKPEGANDPHLLGGLVGVSQALLKIGQNSKTMGIADAALDEAEELTPGQRAALERQRAAADGAIDAAWQDIPRPVESMLRHSPLTGDLQKEGWTPPDPAPAPSPAPGRPPAAADDADAQAQGAARQAQEGDLSGAESGYTKALSRDPTNLDALTGRAQTRLGLENYPGAAADASAALQLAPDDLGAKETLRYATDHLGSALPTAKPGDPWTSAAAGGAAAGGTDAGGMDAGGAVAGGAGGLTAGSPAS